MVVALRILRHRFAVHIGFVLALYLAVPSQIAQQDIAGRLTFHSAGIQGHGIFLSFSALRAATFSMPRPAAFAIPDLPDDLRPRNASFDPDITGSLGRSAALSDPINEYEEPQTTVMNRANKGDRLEAKTKAVAAVSAHPVEISNEEAKSAINQDLAPLENTKVSEEDSTEPRADNAGSLVMLSESASPVRDAMYKVNGLFFADDPLALPSQPFQYNGAVLASLGNASVEGSTTMAGKGEVTGEEAQPRSPAERLGLKGAALAKAEKCLADAIYFESRGEVKKGQIAVSQVVVNRAFSGFYPNDICGVVYQNSNRYLACQFTFACEGKKLKVDEPDMWKQATEISHDMLAGKLWLDEIGKATHYHAYWVRPNWISEMRKIDRIGVHTFYRPRAWEG
jgi:spore germination cell wall hydrolase CwlJ-like protein